MLLCLKRNVSHTSKSSSCHKSFPSVYIIATTCFNECFLFRVITGRHYFLYKFIVTQKFGETAMLLCSLKQVFWKKSAFISVISIITLQCCIYQRSTTKFLRLKFVDSVFYSFSSWIFSFINRTFRTQKLKSSLRHVLI